MTTTPNDPAPGGAATNGAATEEPPTAGPRVSGEEMRDLTRLRRSSYDRKIAGVAGGIARHFDIDPLVVRIALVVMVFFGGGGLLFYLACWLLVPEDTSDRATIPLDDRSRNIALWIVAGIAALTAIGDSIGQWHFPWPLAVVALVILAIASRSGHRRPWVAPPLPADANVTAPSGATPPPPPPPAAYAGYRPPVQRDPAGADRSCSASPSRSPRWASAPC